MRREALGQLAAPFLMLMNYVAANGAQMKSKLRMDIQMTDLWQWREQFDARCGCHRKCGLIYGYGTSLILMWYGLIVWYGSMVWQQVEKNR